MENPFSLSFGKSPPESIERPVPKNEILDSFCTEVINQQIYIIADGSRRGYLGFTLPLFDEYVRDRI